MTAEDVRTLMKIPWARMKVGWILKQIVRLSLEDVDELYLHPWYVPEAMASVLRDYGYRVTVVDNEFGELVRVSW